MRFGNVRWVRAIVGLAVLTVGSTTMAVAQEKRRFFFGVGLGYGSLGVSDCDGYGSDSETGFGWQVGAGYDIRIGTTTALTPTVTYFVSHINGGNVNVIQAALAFSLY